MSALLSAQCGVEFGKPYDPKAFFGRDHREVERFATREEPITGTPAESCTTNLFFGFFFDGTKNNYVLAEAGKNHSNVARQYDCYPGLSVPGVLPESAEWKHKPMPSNFFKVYVPGVASPFDRVGDTGVGDGTPRSNDERVNVGAHRAFEEILRRRHRAISPHWTNEKTGKPAKKDPGIVKTLYISVFGFSGGATQARAFTNWLQSLCKLNAQLKGRNGSMSLGGFPVGFDLRGLFGTVASVGIANTLDGVHAVGHLAHTFDLKAQS